MQFSLDLHYIVSAILTSANVSRFANVLQVCVSQFTDACIERNAKRSPATSICSRASFNRNCASKFSEIAKGLLWESHRATVGVLGYVKANCADPLTDLLSSDP
jgi:hypothetical protein